MIRELKITDYYKYICLLNNFRPSNVNYNRFINIYNSIFNNNGVVYVYLHDDQIIGTGTLVIEEKFIHDGSKYAHIEDIFVDKNHRGKKIGKQILEKLIDYSKNKKCRLCKLNCDKELIEFYTKNGFVPNGNCLYLIH